MVEQDKSNQVNELVDKISEKIGIAANELKPLAETVIHEYIMSNLFQTIFYGIGFIILMLVNVKFLKIIIKKDYFANERVPAITLITVEILVFGGIILCGFISSIARYIAPHYYLLKELL